MTTRPALFATHLSIKNFRGYGRFELDLPPGPCAVLLSGPNGLGKTSLFEAIEWCLTGRVKRLDELAGGRIDARELSRKAPNADTFEVRLAFRDSDGTEARVARTQIIPASGSPAKPVGTPVATVAELLRSDETRWNVGENNVSNYLHLTHLHAQVARLRLVTFKAKERWVRVSPLAGADRFERVRLNLTNAKSALSKLRDQREQELELAEQRVRSWTEKVERFSRLQALRAAAGTALSPTDALIELGELRAQAGLVEERRQAEGGKSLVEATAAIQELRSIIERSLRASGQAAVALDGLQSAPTQYATANAEIEAAALLLDKLRGELLELAAQLQRQSESVTHIQSRSNEAQRTLDHAKARHAVVTAAIRDREDMPRLRAELADAETLLASAARTVEDQEVQLRQRREALEFYADLVRKRNECRERLAATATAMQAFAEIQATRKALAEEEARASQHAASIRDIQEQENAVAAELKLKTELLSSVQEELSSGRTTAERLQQALVTVVEHIADGDTTCPVCRTGFPSGELRSLARASLDVVEPRLQQLETQVSSLGAEQDALRKRDRSLKADRRRVDADLRSSSESLSQLAGRITKLREHPLLAEHSEADSADRLGALRAEQSDEFQRLEREVSAIDHEALRREVIDLSAAVERLHREHAAAHERRNARQTRMDELLARIAQRNAEHPDLEVTEQKLGLIQQAAALSSSQARESVDATASALVTAQAAEESAKRALSSAQERANQAHRGHEAAKASVAAIREQWRACGLPDPIVDTVLDSERRRMAELQHSRESALKRLLEVSKALEVWTEANDLQALDVELRSEQGGAGREEHERALRATVDSARTAFEAAKRAREASDELSEALQRVTAEFGERALLPFDTLFRRYLQALVHDERFHGIEAAYERGGARSASLRFRVDLAGSPTDAEFVLSEGQLGEVSLAAMLAASGTFPWSRWRALLLDDPTQYNDLIHATALTDVLRNLVHFAGYQIIVSTHDGEQASFLRRKFDAVGVPWIDCRYVGHGPDGPIINVVSRLEGSRAVAAS